MKTIKAHIELSDDLYNELLRLMNETIGDKSVEQSFGGIDEYLNILFAKALKNKLYSRAFKENRLCILDTKPNI